MLNIRTWRRMPAVDRIQLVTEAVSARFSNASMARPSKTKPDEFLQLSELPEKAQEMLRPFDLDQDGSLSAYELGRAAQLLMEQKRSLRVMTKVGVGLALLIGILGLTNLFTSVLAAELASKIGIATIGSPAHTTMGDPSVMLSRSGGPVLAGVLKYDVPLDQLPSLGPAPFMSLERISLVEVSGEVRGFGVEGFLYHNRSAATLFLSSGYTLVVRDGTYDLTGSADHHTSRELSQGARGRRLNWCLCCCTFTSGSAHTTISNTGVGTANVGAGNGNSIGNGNTADIASNDKVGSDNSASIGSSNTATANVGSDNTATANVGSGNTATATAKHWW